MCVWVSVCIYTTSPSCSHAVYFWITCRYVAIVWLTIRVIAELISRTKIPFLFFFYKYFLLAMLNSVTIFGSQPYHRQYIYLSIHDMYCPSTSHAIRTQYYDLSLHVYMIFWSWAQPFFLRTWKRFCLTTDYCSRKTLIKWIQVWFFLLLLTFLITGLKPCCGILSKEYYWLLY